MRSLCSLVCVSGVLALTGAASADVIQFTSDSMASTENLGSFEGSLDYNPAQQKLTITITNTSPVANGGFLTGLAFRIGSSDAAASAILVTGPVNFQNLGPAEAPPFGHFVAGAALDADWTGGGQPSRGLGVGQTGVFEFNVTASDGAALEALDFIDVANHPGPDMVVRFRGFADGGSDKVPARPDEVVPAPAGVAVLSAAGLLVATRRRRR
ncbi:MAG TPA: hypothetical protein VD997_16520 [Phycisphaerales bacterium]|nr:hypothetical protein [Phycisphaerales bacterium]